MDSRQTLLAWFNGNSDAADLAELLGDISQVWDDLHDKDVAVPATAVDDMMRKALLGLQRNPFFRRYQVAFDMLMEQAIDTWQEANDLEARGELLHVAYSIRSVITPIWIRIAYLVNGAERGREIAYEIRRAVFSDQSLDDYVTEVLDGLSRRSESEGDEAGAGSGVAVRPG